MKRIVTIAVSTIAVAGIAQLVPAASATWKTNPINNSWNTANNWIPNTVPDGPADVATFNTSSITSVVLSDIEVSEIVFNAGASSFTITPDPLHVLTISGPGIINNSGVTQQFIADQSLLTSDTQPIQFVNSATAGTGTAFQALGGIDEDGSGGGKIEFFDTSSADHASFEIFDAAAPDEARPGEVIFNPGSTAANATFIVHGGVNLRDPGFLVFDGASASEAEITNLGGGVGFGEGADAGNSTITNKRPGTTTFGFTASAGQATITNVGGTSAGGGGAGITAFEDTATAGAATLINEGGHGDQALGGSTVFEDNSTAGNATLIAKAGVDGGAGATIEFYGSSQGGTARAQVFGNATLNISGASSGLGPTIGSLEGDGMVMLGVNNLTIGSANHNTSFAGLIQGTGNVTKTGTGKLTLSGANSFTGGMTVNQGALVVTNTFGSGTGAGPVQANAGTAAGTGTIAGTLTLGTGQGAGVRLLTGLPASPGTLTVQGRVTFNADSGLVFIFDSSHVRGGTLSAKGVTINPGARFIAKDNGNGTLPVGTTFTVISNTALQAIRGSFGNLHDGSTITVGNNTFQAGYDGGTGNDLTLTVVQ